jgi:type I restriction enzyme S subunit
VNESAQPLLPAHPRFKPYPAYKDSGVEWLGEIPAHWNLKRMKAIARLQTGGTPPGVLDEAFAQEGVPWVKPDHLQGDRGITAPDRNLSMTAAKVLGTVRAGSVLVCGIGTVGKTGYAPVEVCTNQQINSITFGSEVIDRYGHFVASCLEQEFARRANKVTIAICNKSEMGDAFSCIPPVTEQRAIAAFLDRETARIDALVAKKERLIELLQEQRTALITRAVTKGLDPTVPMKNSGVEWLGEIPAHWDTSFLDKLVDPLRRITYGIVQPGEPDPDGVLMVRGQNYSFGWSRPEDIFRVSPAIEAPYRRARLKTGDIVMTIVGAGTGNIAIVPEWLEGANLTQTTARIAFDARKANNRYFGYQLQSVVGTVSVEQTVKGAAQPGLNLGHISKYRVVVPPLAEQTLIADNLDRETSGFAALSDKVSEAIERLKELRTALISAAVTGKIDVREEVA